MILPKKYTEVPLDQVMEICRHYGLEESLDILEHDPPKRVPFRSDGASLFPDEIMGVDIYPAAFLHDIAYWCGAGKYNYGNRSAADLRLWRDVVDMCGGSETLGWLMYQGVRVGGSADSDMPWRWGFGR